MHAETLKMWALGKAIENRIVEEWVITLLEELVASVPMKTLTQKIGRYWNGIGSYAGFPFSPKARMTLALSLLEGASSPMGLRPEYKPLKISAKDTPRENFLYLWAIDILLTINALSRGREYSARAHAGDS